MSIFSEWGQRVAFNEGYEKQKITEARVAGADAFALGQDRYEARSLYFSQREILEAEAAQFLADAQTRDNLATSGSLTDVSLDVNDESDEMSSDFFDSLSASENLGLASSVAPDSLYFDTDHWSDVSGLDEFEEML